jgi:hypothetical protein
MAYHGWLGSGFGQADAEKEQLTIELFALEEASDTSGPIATIRGSKALISKLRETSRWDDSRSGITASFLNLVRDDETHHEFLAYTDISARANALIAAAASQLTPEQAAQEGVSGLQRIDSQAAAEHLATTQRLSRSGGEAWEVVRETPEPFVEESVRRGGQVKEVGIKVIDEVAPVGQKLVDELDEREITNPLLGITSLGLLVFMKNKILAVIIILVLIYLTKQRQISAVKAKVQDVKERVQGVADRVETTAGKIEDTAERFS